MKRKILKKIIFQGLSSENGIRYSRCKAKNATFYYKMLHFFYFELTSQMINAAEAAKRIQEFIDSRTVTRDGKKYLPIEENTVRRLMQDLTKSDAEYYAANDDDFRSRA